MQPKKKNNFQNTTEKQYFRNVKTLIDNKLKQKVKGDIFF